MDINGYPVPYGRRVVRTWPFYIYIFILFLVSIMVLTRTQPDSLSKEELVEEFLKFSNSTDQLQSLTKRFDDFIGKYNILHSELLVSKNCNSLLLNRIVKP